jgi:antitoxin component of MazEF toxin-antitoxin module
MSKESETSSDPTAKRMKRRRRYSLEKLVEQITEENRHAEIEWGPLVDNESW